MAIQRNLTEDSLNKLKKTFEESVLPTNPEATFTSFNMADRANPSALEEKVSALELQVSELTTYIKQIFDGHALINGFFRKITPE